MIFEAYWVGRGTQYATLVVLLIFGAYCVGKVHNMLPW